MYKTLLIFLLVSNAIFGQITNFKIKADIQTTKTPQHVNIPCTRLYIVPPPNFQIAKTFIGLEKGSKSFFSIYDVIDGDYYTNAANYNDEEFEKKGIRVIEYKEIKINNYPAQYISIQSNAFTKGLIIVFGDSTFCIMITAMYQASDEKSQNEIIASLNTVWYDKSIKIDPFSTANFSLNDKKCKFKYFKYDASLYTYSIDGKDTKNDQDAPRVLVVQIPKDNAMTVKSIADLFLEKNQQYGLTNTIFKGVSTEKINGYDTYEIEVYGQIPEKNSMLYYCIVANGDKAVVIEGISKKDNEANLIEFKKLSRTIQMK